MKSILSAVLLSLAVTACSTAPKVEKPLPDEEPVAYNYMSRQTVANAVMECKAVKMTPRIIYKRLPEVGYPVPVQVFCDVRYDKLDAL